MSHLISSSWIFMRVLNFTLLEAMLILFVSFVVAETCCGVSSVNSWPHLVVLFWNFQNGSRGYRYDAQSKWHGISRMLFLSGLLRWLLLFPYFFLPSSYSTWPTKVRCQAKVTNANNSMLTSGLQQLTRTLKTLMPLLCCDRPICSFAISRI